MHLTVLAMICSTAIVELVFFFFLRRFYAFEKAHRLDPTSSGRGVRQLKTAILQRLEMENDPTMIERMKKRFVMTCGQTVISAQAYGMNDEFSKVLSQQMEYCSNDPNADTINHLKGEMS
ncbi:vesicle-associated membrane protein 711, partial [Tanacetum coccineum]